LLVRNNTFRMNSSLKLEFIYSTSPEKLWNALTINEEMKKWYFELEEFKPEAGFEFCFWGGTEKNQYLHLCKITEVVVGKKLCHTWQYDGIPGSTNLCFEIIHESEGKTRLLLSHSGFETFPTNNKDLESGNFEIGWNFILGTSLKNYIEQ